MGLPQRTSQFQPEDRVAVGAASDQATALRDLMARHGGGGDGGDGGGHGDLDVEQDPSSEATGSPSSGLVRPVQSGDDESAASTWRPIPDQINKTALVSNASVQATVVESEPLAATIQPVGLKANDVAATDAAPKVDAVVEADGLHQATPKSATQKRARCVAIASGKGGVGKTTITTNLAVSLAQMDRQVVVLDADLGTANVDVLCNLMPRHNLAHVVAGRARIKDVMVTGPGGFKLIPGASGLANIAALGDGERERLIDRMHEVEASADLLLIDCGAGVSPNVLGFALAADTLLVVTTPEPTAITDAYALIKTIVRRAPDADIRLVVNEAKNVAEAKAVYERVSGVCKQFLRVQPGFAGCVLLDPVVTQSVRRRQPFALESPKSVAGQCVRQMAHRLDQHATEPGRHSLFSRMAAWLGRG